MSSAERLKQQLIFIWELDALKNVFRQTYLLDESRKENDAEHSWHLAIMAALLAEHATVEVDVGRVIKMLLLHDVVEIDAGDTYCYDDAGNRDKHARELTAADRIFALLPVDQASECRALWDEFEARESADARFARALDRLQPMMHNYLTGGRSWREHGVDSSVVLEQNREIEDGSAALWDYATALIQDAVNEGFLPAGPVS